MPIYRDVSLLNPKFAPVVVRLHKYLIDAHETGRTKTRFEIFETFRDPMRQTELLKKGASKAGPFQSAHQFGLAVDFVPYIDGPEATVISHTLGERVMPGWSWWSGHDYDFLREAARQHGLDCPISWDLVHVEHTKFGLLESQYRKYVE